jgi:hypothetical protein
MTEKPNQWLFAAKKKQGLELGGLYFRRVPFILFYGACSQNERRLGCVELKKVARRQLPMERDMKGTSCTPPATTY